MPAATLDTRFQFQSGEAELDATENNTDYSCTMNASEPEKTAHAGCIARPRIL
jgi:hypothetical protein